MNKQSSQSEDIRKFIDSEIALSQQADLGTTPQKPEESEKSSSSSEPQEKLIELVEAEQENGSPSDSEQGANSEEDDSPSRGGEDKVEDQDCKAEQQEKQEEEQDQDEQDQSDYSEEVEPYIPPRRELPQRNNRGARMQNLIEKGLEEDDKNLWKELVGSDFTQNESGESKSFNEEASSLRSSEKHDSEDSDIDLSESEGEYSDEEREMPKKNKTNLNRPRKKINFQEIDQILENEEIKQEESEEEEGHKETVKPKQQEKLEQEWEKVKSSKAEAKIRKELRNLRPHRQFNFKDMVDFSPSQLKIDSSTARQTRGAEMRGKSKSHSKSKSQQKSKKAKPKPVPIFEMPSQEEMLRQCAYNELVNSQLTNLGGQDYHYPVGQKKYLEKRIRQTKDWSKMDQGFNMRQLLKECRVSKIQRVGQEGRVKHYLKVRTPLDSLRFEEGEQILQTADVLFPDRHDKLKQEHRKREKYQIAQKEGKYRDPLTTQRYNSTNEYIQLQKNVMAKEDDQLMSLYVSVNEFLSANK